jgi:2-keto-4-pentenoate hydratase/2-oxohepta-3-ene-1,7-dioic acid hydratase in catechol pathway
MVSLPIFNNGLYYNMNPTKIIALGLNYMDHIQESHSVNVKGFTKERPTEPVLFPKLPSSLIGPNDPIIIPQFLLEYHFDPMRVDYEAELAFIIRKRCKNVSVSDAMNFIYGFTALNDVSQRNIQTGDKSGWFRGKSLDTFCPMGPQIVLLEDIGDPQNLHIECRLNGKKVQESNTKYMIFSIAEMLSFISKNFTLEAGDIISTGTPSGVGQIHHGDVVEIEIEKIGILSNPVVEEWKL